MKIIMQNDFFQSYKQFNFTLDKMTEQNDRMK